MGQVLTQVVPRFLSKILFRSFEAKETFLSQVDELRRRNPDRPIAFATLSGGVIEFWALRSFLYERFGKEFELRRATNLPTFFLDPLGMSIRRVLSFIGLASKVPSRLEQCSHELDQRQPVLLNIESGDRQKSFQTPISEVHFSYLIERHENLIVVPTIVIWRRSKKIEELVPDDIGSKAWVGVKRLLFFPWYFFLGDPYRPTGIRKLAILMRGYAKSSLRLSAEILVNKEQLSARALRRKVLNASAAEKRIVLGPTFRSTRMLGEGILRGNPFQSFIRTLAQNDGVSEIVLLKKAEKYFREISAHYSYATLETCAWLLHKVFHSLYEGITTDENDFEKIRKASREGSVVFVPCHRSYVDFLLLSYLLFQKEIAPPHVAAGINLNFWPIGEVFKQGGAFFIRRSFRGNILYAEVLRRYIAALLSNKVNLEFFIEGTRSRNGKLAPPKYGIMKMIMDSYLEGSIREKVRFIPVSITYDKVTESRAHKRELEGGAKVQENMINAVKSTRVLFKKYGKVHVRFGDAIALEEWVNNEVGEGTQSLDSRKLAIQKLAFEVCHRINGATPLTGEGLVCAALLAKPGAAMAKNDLEAWLLRIKEDLVTQGSLLSIDLKEDFARATRRAIARLVDDGVVEKYHGPLNVLGLRIPRGQRIAALYNKNTVIHAFTTSGIWGLCEGRFEEALELRALFQFEFFFAEKDAFLETLRALPKSLLSEYYALWFDDVLETIDLGLHTLELAHHAGQGTADLKEWRARLLKWGKTAQIESSLIRLEAVNTQSFSAFLDMAQNRGWLKKSSDSSDLLKVHNLESIQATLDRIKYFRNKLVGRWENLKEKHLEPIRGSESSVSPIQ